MHFKNLNFNNQSFNTTSKVFKIKNVTSEVNFNLTVSDSESKSQNLKYRNKSIFNFQLKGTATNIKLDVMINNLSRFCRHSQRTLL